MPTQRFLIAPYDQKSGLNLSVRPWIIPDNAFAALTNAYVFRGRVRKRVGTRYFSQTDPLLSRLRYNVANYSIAIAGGSGVGITNGSGNATGTAPGTLFQVGQRFVIGAETDTVTSSTPGAQPMTSTGPSTTHTFNIGTGAYVFVAAPINTQIYFFPNPTTTDVTGSIAGLLPNAPIAIGTMFSIGQVKFTVYALGTPANLLVSNGSATLATLNTTTGRFTFVNVLDSIGNPVSNTAVYFYPNLPVTGLLNITGNSTVNYIIGFDTQYAYHYNDGWDRLANGVSTWTGSDSQLFWGTTWVGGSAGVNYFFVTNFNENEPNNMRYLNSSTLAWSQFRPLINGSTYVNAARIMVVFKKRLILLNTFEGTSTTGGINYVNRARYSWIGDPTDANAFVSGTPGNGSAIDAPTLEAIVTAEFLKDRLIVYFESSTWELVFTNNQAFPFTWQKINTELGAESTFSVVPFDKVVLGIGQVGFHSCNGSNVERIDDKIPNEVFNIHYRNSGVDRVYGIRDYYTELVYWTYPSTQESSDASNPFPRRIFVYNYKNSTWAFFDDSITVFGYWKDTGTNSGGITWDSTTVTWDDAVPWGTGPMQSTLNRVVGGNQQGYTFILDENINANASVLQITDITASGTDTLLNIINHNLRSGDYIYISDCSWNDASNGLNGNIYEVINIYIGTTIDPNNILIMNAPFTGAYIGGGLISWVSNINIETKQFNFFGEQGRNIYIPKVEFLVTRTDYGEITANYFVSTSGVTLLQDSITQGSIVGTGVLETYPYPSVPFEAQAERLWHPVYFQGDGEVVQFQLTMSPAQMMDPDIRTQDFQLHAMMIYGDKTSYRFQ